MDTNQPSDRKAGIMINDSASSAPDSVAVGSAVGNIEGNVNMVRLIPSNKHQYKFISKI